MERDRFSWFIHLKRALIGGLTSYVLSALIGLSLHLCIVIGIIGLLSGQTFDIVKFNRRLR